jgi:hypothetical protein
VANGDLANMNAATIKGNNTGGAAAPLDLTVAQVTAMLNLFTSTLQGLVPQSGGGTTNFLRADGTWGVPPGTGGGISDGDKGEITVASGATVWTIDDDVVTNAKLAPAAANSLKGNNTGASAGPTDLTTAQVTAMLDLFTSSLKGLVPSSSGGTTNFLRADGTWAAPAGGVTDGDKGEISITSGVWTIDADVVTNTKIAPMATMTLKGNNTGSTAGPTDLTSAQATAMLDLFTSSLRGLVPLSGGGTTNFLRADGTWAPAGGGGIDLTRVLQPEWIGGNPAPAFNVLLGTNTPVGRLPVFAFDPGTIEYIHAVFTLPANYLSGGTLRIKHMCSVVTSTNTIYAARVIATTPADADTPLERAWSTAASVTIATNTTEARRVVEGTITLNMDSAAANDVLQIIFYRDATNGSDNMAADSEVISITFEYESATS